MAAVCSSDRAWLVRVLPVLLAASLAWAQDVPRIERGKYSLPAVREVVFDPAGFPIVLEPDPESRTGCYLSVPFERVEGTSAVAEFELMVEEWDEIPEVDEDNSYEVGLREKHVSLTMQVAKTGTPSGFCVSSRKLQPGKVCKTVLAYHCAKKSVPPDRFYLTLHVPYWVKRVTVMSVGVGGHRFIEKEPEATAGEMHSIDEWIEQLAAEDFAHRKQAHEALVAMGGRALPQLQSCLDDDDPERRVRVEEIIDKVRQNERERMPPVKIEK